MEALFEHVDPVTANIITESPNGEKTMFLKGVFMQADIENRNGRVYPLSEMAKVVQDANRAINASGGIFGELDHPQTLTINMDRISHVITELYMSGSNVVGKAKLLNTPTGLIAQELSRSGCRYGVSSRGAGNLTEGHVSDYRFVTADLVAVPSAAGAMPDTIYESLLDTTKGRKILTLHESIREDESAQKYLQKAITDFVASIMKK